jgi:hypothetical protein
MKERTYCKILGDTFSTTYSPSGISRFKGEKGAWGEDSLVYCTELNKDSAVICPVFEKLEKIVKEKLKEKE